MIVDWVDSWFYHLHFGGIHCGTNVLRIPQRGQLPAWWSAAAPSRNGSGGAGSGG